MITQVLYMCYLSFPNRKQEKNDGKMCYLSFPKEHKNFKFPIQEKNGVIIVVVVLAMVHLTVEPGRAISYGQVNAALAPCVPYLIGDGNPITK